MVKITEKKAKEYKFSDVDDFDLFGYIGKIYMKLPKTLDLSAGQKPQNAICFDTGKYQWFCDGDRIVKYDSEIIVTKVY